MNSDWYFFMQQSTASLCSCLHRGSVNKGELGLSYDQVQCYGTVISPSFPLSLPLPPSCTPSPPSFPSFPLSIPHPYLSAPLSNPLSPLLIPFYHSLSLFTPLRHSPLPSTPLHPIPPFSAFHFIFTCASPPFSSFHYSQSLLLIRSLIGWKYLTDTVSRSSYLFVHISRYQLQSW